MFNGNTNDERLRTAKKTNDERNGKTNARTEFEKKAACSHSDTRTNRAKQTPTLLNGAEIDGRKAHDDKKTGGVALLRSVASQ